MGPPQSPVLAPGLGKILPVNYLSTVAFSRVVVVGVPLRKCCEQLFMYPACVFCLFLFLPHKGKYLCVFFPLHK